MAGQPTYDDLAQRIKVLEDENSKLQQTQKVLGRQIEKLNLPLINGQYVVFEDLFNLVDIQCLQDDFAKATGVASIITSPDGTPITAPSNFCRLCTEFIRKSEKGLANCLQSDAIIGRLHSKGPIIQRCLSGGLWDAGAGITVGGRHIANWLVGQVRDTAQTEDRIREYAREIGSNEEDMVEAFLETPCMPHEQFEQVAKLLFTTATQLSGIAYQNFEQKRFIADRKRAEDALRRSEKEYRATLDNLAVGVVVHAGDTSILFSNKEATNILGPCYNQLFSKKESDSGWSFVHEDLSVTALEDYPAMKVLGTKNPVRDSVVGVKRPDRNYLTWVTVNAVPVMSSDGEVNKIIVNFIDITDQKRAESEKQRLEAQLHQAAKMEALGTLAGGIAHDFNNILSAILGHGQMALDELPPASDACEDIKQVIASGNRAADLVKRILLFSRQEDEDFLPIQVQAAIEEVVGMFSSTLPSSIKLSNSIDWNCGTIHANPAQIHQVIMNLLTNARQAIKDDYGSISIALSDTLPPSSLFSDQSGDNAAQRYACIEICDSGCGVPKELQTKIFDPFFTTKSEKKGTGLGLAVVDGIVRKHKGFVALKSGVKGGSVFQIYLPIIESIHTAALPEKESTTKGCERILLIDDEWPLVNLHKRFLEKCGYHVTGFSDSLEALKSFQQNSDSYDIVVTDMTMPNLTGIDLIRETMQTKPDIQSIVCTGYSESVTEEIALSLGVKAFLLKPFSPLLLAKTIRKVFDNA